MNKFDPERLKVDFRIIVHRFWKQFWHRNVDFFEKGENVPDTINTMLQAIKNTRFFDVFFIKCSYVSRTARREHF